jgi:hypothetical protein
MADGLDDSDGPATGSTSLSEWIDLHGQELGREYANELTRHYHLNGNATYRVSGRLPLRCGA